MKNFYKTRHKEIIKIINKIDIKKLKKIEDLILKTYELGGKVIICGT